MQSSLARRDQPSCAGRQAPHAPRFMRLCAHPAGNFLGSARMHLAGFLDRPGKDRNHLRAICRHGNAKLHTELSSKLAWIVVRLRIAPGVPDISHDILQPSCCAFVRWCSFAGQNQASAQRDPPVPRGHDDVILLCLAAMMTCRQALSIRLPCVCAEEGGQTRGGQCPQEVPFRAEASEQAAAPARQRSMTGWLLDVWSVQLQ